MITRTTYLDKLQKRKDKPVIKVITGLRRSGKSVIMRQFMQTLGTADHVIYIDKENIAFDSIKNYLDLYEYISRHQSSTKKNYIIIDEIQYIDKREKTVASLANQSEQYDIYITGSNSTLLSSELATSIAGRYILIHVLPLSFSEFCQVKRTPKLSRSLLFTQYLRQGGLPGLLGFEDQHDLQQDYLQGIKNTIVLKDIIDRFAIRNTTQFENTLSFLADNIGNLFSAKKIVDYLKSQYIGLSITTLQDYLQFTQSTYLIYKLQRYDIKGKRILEINEKRYFGDIGLRNSIVGWKEKDIASILENIVYLELIKRGYNVYLGIFGQQEIDFVATKPGGTVEYFQVSYLLTDEKTRKREFGNLAMIQDNYPKTVITMDETPPSSNDGIQRVHIIDWLQNTSE